MYAKNNVKNIFLSFASVIIFLFIVEMLLRVLGFPSRILEFVPSEESFFYFMKPNQEYIEKWYERQPLHKIKINSQGFRDNEIEYENGYKILCLGDSFTYGAGVNFEETFVDRLEKSLRKLKPDVGFEVINGGHGGSTIDHQLAVFKEKALKFVPQILMLQFSENDVLDYHSRERTMAIYKPIKLPFKNLLRRTAIYIQLYKLRLYVAALKVGRNIKEAQNISITKDNFYDMPLTPFWQKAWEEYLVKLQELVDICKANNIKLVLCVIPSVEQVKDESKVNVPQRKIGDFVKKNNAIFIDPLEDLRTQGAENAYIQHDAHINAQGHKIITDCILEKLVDIL